MLTGFYNLNGIINCKTTLKSFYKDAVMLSYFVNIQKIDNYVRVGTNEVSIMDIIDFIKCENELRFNHYTCVDRSIQHEYEKKGEVGINVIADDGNDYFLFCYMTLENLSKLAKMYKLKME